MNARSSCLLYRGKIGEHEVYAVFIVLGFVCVNLRDLRENRPFTHTKNYVDEYKEQQ